MHIAHQDASDSYTPNIAYHTQSGVREYIVIVQDILLYMNNEYTLMHCLRATNSNQNFSARWSYSYKLPNFSNFLI